MKKIMHISMFSRFFISKDQDVSRTAGIILERKKKSIKFPKHFFNLSSKGKIKVK